MLSAANNTPGKAPKRFESGMTEARIGSTLGARKGSRRNAITAANVSMYFNQLDMGVEYTPPYANREWITLRPNQKGCSPRITRIRTTAMATRSSKWINPPKVYEVISHNNQRTKSIAAMLYNISNRLGPISPARRVMRTRTHQRSIMTRLL